MANCMAVFTPDLAIKPLSRERCGVSLQCSVQCSMVNCARNKAREDADVLQLGFASLCSWMRGPGGANSRIQIEKRGDILYRAHCTLKVWFSGCGYLFSRVSASCSSFKARPCWLPVCLQLLSMLWPLKLLLGRMSKLEV